METMRRFVFVLLAAMAVAQNVSQSIAPSYTLNGTALPNPTGFASQFNLNVEDLWDLLIGPVVEAATTTTVSATPVPSSSLVPPPPLYFPPFPTGAQVVPTKKNDSWSFPKDFWYGYHLLRRNYN
jgi:beta-glucosidase